MAHPPMKSKYGPGPSEYELKTQRKAQRNEKARLRMARKRAELKERPLEEQVLAKARTRLHQATYRQKAYKVKYDPMAYISYIKAKHARRLARRRGKEAYRSAEDQLSDDDEQPSDGERYSGHERDSGDDQPSDDEGSGSEDNNSAANVGRPDGWADTRRARGDGYGRLVDAYGRMLFYYDRTPHGATTTTTIGDFFVEGRADAAVTAPISAMELHSRVPYLEAGISDLSKQNFIMDPSQLQVDNASACLEEKILADDASEDTDAAIPASEYNLDDDLPDLLPEDQLPAVNYRPLHTPWSLAFDGHPNGTRTPNYPSHCTT
ncbi:hypothetical protein B0H13DRAFT_1899736 [Mycena leptocephala]|nr:hypothetical protein B0H13DRAFT_1899736 [Mycena leptocephala]